MQKGNRPDHKHKRRKKNSAHFPTLSHHPLTKRTKTTVARYKFSINGTSESKQLVSGCPITRYCLMVEAELRMGSCYYRSHGLVRPDMPDIESTREGSLARDL